MPSTPEEWLPVLARRLDDEYPRTSRLRRYGTGKADLPEMGKNLRASWEAFQRKARTDYGGLCIHSLADRICLLGVVVGREGTPATAAARRIWRDNRLDVQFDEALEDYLTVGRGYLVEGWSEGGAVITREAPEQFYAQTDPLRPWKARAALKVWRDPDVGESGTDFAMVWVPGLRQLFSRPSVENGVRYAKAQGGWVPVEGGEAAYDGDVPVYVMERRGGEGLIEPHLDVIDRINLGKLNRLVVTAMQAFRQRALKTAPDSAGLPERDQDGNPIDYEKVFSPAPGALWDLPAGIDVWESQQADIRPLLEGEKSDARDFAAVTRTPISVFIPEGQNQSAEGAANATAGQVRQAEKEIARIKPVLEVALVRALEIEGVDLGGETLEVSFEPPAYVSLSEKYAAAAQAKAAGEPWKSIARNILGYSPDQIAQADLDRTEEQLAATSLFAPAQGGATGGAAVA